MIVKQGRTKTVVVYSNVTDAHMWDGVVRRVVITSGPEDRNQVVIGHLAYRTPRSQDFWGKLKVWHATTETDPAKLKKARWWSAFENTGVAEAVLLGLWLGGRPDSAPAETAPAEAVPAGQAT